MLTHTHRIGNRANDPSALPCGADGEGFTTLASGPGAFGAVGWVSRTSCHRGYVHTLAGAVEGTVTYLGLQPLLDEFITCDTAPPVDPETTPRPQGVPEETTPPR